MKRKLGVLAAGLVVLAGSMLTVGCGSSSNSSARLRVVNASPDEASIDTLVDTKSFATSTGYGGTSGYKSLSSGSREIKIEATGTTAALIDQTVSVNEKTDYTYLVSNFSSNIAGILFADDNTAPASGSYRVRIINASPSLGPADVYIVTPGTDINSVPPNISSLAFQSASAYQTFTAGSFQIFFTTPGSKLIFVDSGPITFNAGQVRTVVGLDGSSGGFFAAVLPDLN